MQLGSLTKGFGPNKHRLHDSGWGKVTGWDPSAWSIIIPLILSTKFPTPINHKEENQEASSPNIYPLTIQAYLNLRLQIPRLVLEVRKLAHLVNEQPNFECYFWTPLTNVVIISSGACC